MKKKANNYTMQLVLRAIYGTVVLLWTLALVGLMVIFAPKFAEALVQLTGYRWTANAGLLWLCVTVVITGVIATRYGLNFVARWKVASKKRR